MQNTHREKDIDRWIECMVKEINKNHLCRREEKTLSWNHMTFFFSLFCHLFVAVMPMYWYMCWVQVTSCNIRWRVNMNMFINKCVWCVILHAKCVDMCESEWREGDIAATQIPNKCRRMCAYLPCDAVDVNAVKMQAAIKNSYHCLPIFFSALYLPAQGKWVSRKAAIKHVQNVGCVTNPLFFALANHYAFHSYESFSFSECICRQFFFTDGDFSFLLYFSFHLV